MNVEEEKQIQQVELLLLKELILFSPRRRVFSAKWFRQKYNVSEWEYWKAVKTLKDIGFIEVDERKKPVLADEFLQEIVNAVRLL